ncbi:MAG: flagellar basal body rod protein FlgB [Roseiarcus sp.]
MSEVYLFKLASQRTQWLNLRQSLIAENVSNANTPGYLAKDLPSFTSVLAQTHITMAATEPGHLQPTSADLIPPRPEEEDAANATLSGNTVNLESEMIKLGDVGRAANTTNAIKKIFHQMMISALK